MRLIPIAAFAIAAVVSLDLSAQERRRGGPAAGVEFPGEGSLSPQREARRQACRQEARQIYKTGRRAVAPSEADRELISNHRRAYTRECMQRGRL